MTEPENHIGVEWLVADPLRSLLAAQRKSAAFEAAHGREDPPSVPVRQPNSPLRERDAGMQASNLPAVLVAVSGGGDSVCLALILSRLTRTLDFSLAVGHVDHGIRVESARDADWLERFCQDRGLAFFKRTIPPGTLCGPGLEGQARTRRYQLLGQMAHEAGCGFIATAHTASDQAETLLMRMLRGAASGGLSGIHPVNTDLAPVPVIRPLLGVTRGEVDAYLERHGVFPCQDSTNLDESITRNRIRHRLLPVLRDSFNPGVETGLCRLAANLRQEDEALNRWPLPPSLAVLEGVPDSEPMEVADLVALPPPVRIRFLRRRLRAMGVKDRLQAHHWDRLNSLLERKNGGTQIIHLPDRLIAIREYGTMQVVAGHREGGVAAGHGRAGGDSPRRGNLEGLEGEVVLKVPCTIVLPWHPELAIKASQPPREVPDAGEGVSVQACSRDLSFAPDGREVAEFDADQVFPPLRARPWKPGDTMRPFGGAGSRKIKKILGDGKVPFSERSTVTVVEDSKGIVWLCGHRRSCRAPLCPETRRRLRLEVLRLPQTGTDNIERSKS